MPGKIISANGPTGMFRGLEMACGREGIFTCGYLGLGPAVITNLEERGWEKNTAKIGGSIMGGVFAATLSHPMDTIKTCQQGDIEGKKFGTLSQTARTLYGEAGAGAFFRGWSWRTGRMILCVFIFNECKVRLSPLMFPHHFKDEEQ